MTYKSVVIDIDTASEEEIEGIIKYASYGTDVQEALDRVIDRNSMVGRITN